MKANIQLPKLNKPEKPTINWIQEDGYQKISNEDSLKLVHWILSVEEYMELMELQIRTYNGDDNE